MLIDVLGAKSAVKCHCTEVLDGNRKAFLLRFFLSKILFQRTDSSLLAQFFYADRDLNLITDQLEKFDGHKNVEQFSGLITELRKSQDSLLSVIEKIMDEIIPESRASRDFRVKFPDDILQESLAGRLWFGAEVGYIISLFIVWVPPLFIWTPWQPDSDFLLTTLGTTPLI